MDEKELAVRLYKAWYGIEEFNGEASKLKPHWLRVAAEAARIAKEARVEALAACWAAGSTKGCREALQQLIDAETAPEKPDE